MEFKNDGTVKAGKTTYKYKDLGTMVAESKECKHIELQEPVHMERRIKPLTDDQFEAMFEDEEIEEFEFTDDENKEFDSLLEDEVAISK